MRCIKCFYKCYLWIIDRISGYNDLARIESKERENYVFAARSTEYTDADADFQNLTTIKLFQQTYRPRIQAENFKVPMSRLLMLVAAKWRDLTSLGKGEEVEEVAEEQEEQEEDTGTVLTTARN